MSIDVPPELEDLGIALGLLGGNVGGPELDLDFFTDPAGQLAGMLTDEDQRDALLGLLAAVLGTDDVELDLPTAPAGETWLPLVEEGSGGLYLVTEVVGSGPGAAVRLSVAGRVGRSGDGVESSASIRVPLLEISDSGISPLVGGSDGAITIGATLAGDGGPLVSEDGFIVDGLSVRATIATDPAADPPATLGVVVEGLVLAAGDIPEDLDLVDLASDLDARTVRLLLAALRGRAGTVPELGHLFALLGLGPAGAIPSLPLAGLFLGDPASTIRSWLRSLVVDTTAREAWLAELAALVGATVPTPGELCFVDTAATTVCLTVTSDTDPVGGAPRVRVGLRARHRAGGGTASGELVAGAELVRATLGSPPSLVGLPDLRAVVRLTGAAGAPLVDLPDVDGHDLDVGSLEVGVAMRADRSLVPVLTARDVVLDTTTHPVLDLTDADAVMGAAADTAAASLSELLRSATDLLDGDARAIALAALLGLRPPPGAAWTPALAEPAKLLVDPLRELCCYHARVLAVPDAWPRLLGQLLVLVGPDGTAAPAAVPGAGTPTEPWRLALAADATGSIDLLVWSQVDDAGSTHLLLGAGARVGTELTADARLEARLTTELLDATLPVAADCSGPVGLDVARCYALTLTLGDDLTFDAGEVTVQAQRVELGVRWCRGGDPEPEVRITGGRVVSGAGVVELPDLDPAVGLDLTALSGEVVMALGDLFGAWFSGGGANWWRLGPLLGLLPGLPDVPGFGLPDLPDLAARLRDATAWHGLLDPSGGGRVSGTGMHADPWVLRTGANDLPDLLAWLDPDGPPAPADVARGLLPAQLTEALEGAADALSPERLAELLGRAVSVAPELADAVDADLGEALRLLREQLSGTDGLVPSAAQVAAGWQRIDLPATTHLGAPATLDLPRDLPGLPPAARQVFVSAPLPWAEPWTDTDPSKVIDLREPGRDATTFDLDHVTGPGPWQVLLPPRADAVSAAEPDGLDGLVARLLAALTTVTAAVGGPVALIAHGSSGHAARRVAATPGVLTDVVTVATPHLPVSRTWLEDPSIRTAVRTLQRLRARAAADSTALGPLAGVLDTVTAALDGVVTEQEGSDTVRRHVPFPFADYDAPASWPALAAGVTGHCVVATLGPEAVDGALTELVGRGIEAVVAAPTGRAVPTHVGLGVRTRLAGGAATAGAVRIDADLRADLHLVEVSAGADRRAVPRLSLHVDLARNGGWLVAPESTGLGEPQDPRVRRAELDLTVELGEPVPAAGTVAPRLRAVVTLRDVSVLGRWHERWIVDDSTVGSLAADVGGASGALPEVRLLLGKVAEALGTVPADGTLRHLADLLGALGAAQVEADGRLTFVTDGLTRLLADPDAVLADGPGIDALLDAVAALGGGSRTTDGVVLTASSDVEVAVRGDLPDATLAIGTPTPRTIAKDVELDAHVSVDASGHLVARVELLSPVELGPVGRPRLELGVDTGRAEQLSLAVTLPDDELGSLPSSVALLPTPDLDDLGRLAAAVLPGELLRQALTWAHAEAPAVVDPLLDVLGLLAPDGAPLPVRSCAGLVADPAGWLASPIAMGASGATRRLAPARLRSLVDALAGMLGQAAPGGTLTLPGGFSLTADAAPDARGRLLVSLPAAAAGGGVSGSVGVLLGDELDLAPTVALRVELGPVAGLDAGSVSIGADGSDPALSLQLTPAGRPSITLPLLPSAGWGALTTIADAGVAAGVQLVLPFVLDAAASEVPVLGTLGDALGVRTAGAFDGTKLRSLASDPAAALRDLAAVPSLLAALDDVLDAVGVTAITVATASSTIAVTPVTGLDVTVTLGATPGLAVALTPAEPVAGLALGGEVSADTSGITGAAVMLEVTDPSLLGTGPVMLLPFLRLEVGDLAPGADRLLAGLWNGVPATATRRALAAGLPLTSLVPALTCLRADLTPEADTTGCVTEVALGMVLPLVGDLVLAADEVTAVLDATLLGEAKLLGDALVAADVLSESAGDYALVPGVFTDLAALPGRLLAIAAQLVTTIADETLGDTLGPVSITPVTDADPDRTWYGLRLDLDEALSLADGDDIGLSLDVYRGAFGDGGARGITLYAVSHPIGADLGTPAGLAQVRCTPRIEVAELGLRITGPGSADLLDEPVGIASAGLFGSYDGRVTVDAVGEVTGWHTEQGGGRLAVRRLSIPLGGGGNGGNPVAQKMLSQASESEQAGDDEQLTAGFDVELQLSYAAGSGTDVDLHVGLGDPPWWLPIQRSFGPLYVDELGLVLEDLEDVRTVGVLFDGGIELAGLAVGVDDLGLLYHLQDRQLELTLAGIAIAYEGGGLQLSGGLRRAGTEYLGMLQLQFGEYGLTAIGGWGEHPATAPESQRYTALFVFGVLTAPLGGPPPFFVTAIGAGFGINRRLVLPARVDDVPTYPLVDAMRSDSTLAQDPMGALDRLADTFPPHRGTFWFAAGVRFTSFVLVESVAVLGVELGDGLEVGLLGLSRLELPDPSLPMASVELALRARFSTREGLLAIQAQLTDNSWLLSEDCRLTGGFAFVVWFRTGQFVLTLGGYHPRFDRPADFPDVPRLGYHWSVSDAITIKGGLYFALTSSAIMAGGSFEASYRTSWAWASFEMGANALVMWDPFRYDFEVYVRISAGVRLRICVPLLGCATVGFSFSIGARVHVLGPRFRGTAELDLDVATITVHFGASGDANEDQGLGWDEFRPRYLTDGDRSSGLEASLGEGRYVEAGAPSSAADDAVDGPWELLPEFTVLMTTTVASTHFNGAPAAGVDAIDLGPMRIAGTRTELVVTLHDGGPDAGPPDDPHGLITIEARRGQLPEAVWRTHDRSGDAPATADLVTAVTGARLVVRARVLDHTGEIPIEQVDVGELVHPLPLRQQVRWRDDLELHHELADELVAWAGARGNLAAVEQLVAGGRLTPVAGGGSARWRVALTGGTPVVGAHVEDRALVTDRSEALVEVPAARSNGARVARPASLLGRAAPPRVRSLAGGMRREVTDPVRVDRIEAPIAPSRPAPRLHPRLEAVLHEVAVPREVTPPTRARRVGDGLPRVAPPSLAATREAVLRTTGAQLHTVPPPITERLGGRAGTRAPTGIAGDRHEWRVADSTLAPSRLRALRRLEQDVTGDGVSVPTGRVHVWHVPDSHRDDRRGRLRPRLEIAGDIPVRVVALDRAGRVLTDRTTTDGTVVVPHGTSRVAVAGVAGGGHGLAGWHAGTRMARASARTLLAPGAVVRSEAGSTRRGGRTVTTGLATGADVVPSRGTVSTTLPRTTLTVVVALEPLGADATPDGFRLSLEGATRRGARPLVVRTGERVHGLFRITTDEDVERITAHVATDEHWQLAAVVGTPDEVDVVAAWLTDGGLERALPGLATAAGGEARVRWAEPEDKDDA